METSEIINLIVLIITAIGVIYTIKSGFKKEREKNENWKKQRETTDLNQDNTIKTHAEKIKEQVIANENNSRRIEELDAKFQKEISKLTDIFNTNKENLKDEITKIINNVEPMLKEHRSEMLKEIKEYINNREAITNKDIEHIKEELKTKTSKRPSKK